MSINSRVSFLTGLTLSLSTLTACSDFSGLSGGLSKSSSFNPINSLTVSNVGTTGDVSVSKSVFGTPLTIRSSGHMAGAIDSITWNGVEFINSSDHGRELQSASSFDNLGECYNPTEAGARDDVFNSSSSLSSRVTNDGELLTTSNMAFWLPPLSAYAYTCGASGLHQAQNSSVLSGNTLEKHVIIGAEGYENIINYFVRFDVPAAHSAAAFEAMTAYMPNNFSVMFTYNPSSQGFDAIIGDGSIKSQPVVFSTGDGSHAMGVISPELTAHPRAGAGYGAWSASLLGGGPAADTVKWNFYVTESAIAAGAYSYHAYVIVGNLDQVSATLRAIYKEYAPASVMAPPTATAPPALRAIYRLNNGNDYLFSTSSNEAADQGFQLEGAAFSVAVNPGANLAPLYRCLITGAAQLSHFLSMDPACEGQSNDGPLGYITGPGISGRPQLHRMWNPLTGVHLETVSANEGLANGYIDEGILGSVW